MSARQLPEHPSLRHLRNEAKALCRSVSDGDIDAVARVRPHLRRLGELSDAQVAAADVTLQEVQHALARDYGFTGWPALVEAVEPRSVGLTIDCIADLPPLEAERAVRYLDRRDLILSLVETDAAIGERILSYLSADRQEKWTRRELEHESRTASPEKVREARRRSAMCLSDMMADGTITWPPKPATKREVSPALDDGVLALLRTPVPDLDQDRIVALMGGLASYVADHEWNALEGPARQASEFVGEGIRLIIDGTEEPLVLDLLRTRALPLIHRARTHMVMATEAVNAIAWGDNPRIVAYKMEMLYKESVSLATSAELSPGIFSLAQLDDLRDTLRRGPFRDLPLDEMRDFYVRLDILCRRDGVQAMADLHEDADDAVLALALRLLPRMEAPEFLPQVEACMARAMEDIHHRYHMAADGLCAVQSGAGPDQVETAIRAVERKSYEEIGRRVW